MAKNKPGVPLQMRTDAMVTAVGTKVLGNQVKNHETAHVKADKGK